METSNKIINKWISVKDNYPPHPNKGKIYLVHDRQWPNLAFFHRDPETGKPWWEGLDSTTLIGITDWYEYTDYGTKD